MKQLDKRYMYNNEWTDKEDLIFRENHHDINKPYIVKIANGIILPEKLGNLPWGIGGCINESDNLVKESIIPNAFGGKYHYNKNDVVFLDESIILIPIIPNHWGHFLIDVVSRLWIFLDNRYQDKASKMKIYYCAWGWKNNILSGNILEFLNLMGISERMICVTKPIRAKEIWIPSFTMSFSTSYNDEYKLVIEHVIQKVINSNIVKDFSPCEKIYFTRTNLPSSKLKEIGEKQIEEVMRANGFSIFSPEKMSLEEQIYYINNCKIMAGMSGTITHNIVFSNTSMKLYIVNRTCMPNRPQLMFNKMYPNEVFFIDAYCVLTTKHPRDYGSGPFWVVTNKNFQLFCSDLGLMLPLHIQNQNKIQNLLKYYFSLLYYSITRSKFVIFIYYKILRK